MHATREAWLTEAAALMAPWFDDAGSPLTVLAALGPLPHGRLDPTSRPRKKDGIRQLKVSCPVCGYVARTSRRWLDVGAPICPTDSIPMCEGDEP